MKSKFETFKVCEAGIFLRYVHLCKLMTGLEIATDMVANATNFFSLAMKNSGLVATLVTRFFYDLDLN